MRGERLPRYGAGWGGESVSLFICLFSDAVVNSMPRFVSGSLL